MKNKIIYFIMKIVLPVFFLFFHFFYSNGQYRENILLQSGWKFSTGNFENAQSTDFDDSLWKTVKVPHDWGVESSFNREGNGKTGKLPWKGEGWYRKEINIESDLSHKIVYIVFDGVMAFPEVFVNGMLAGKWDYGYNSFYLDISKYLVNNKKNVLAVHVDTRKHDSRWYPGAGIFRKVNLLIVNPLHVKVWGSYVTTPIIKPNYTDVRISHNILNKSDVDVYSVSVENTVYDPAMKKIETKTSSIDIKSGKSRLTEVTINLNKPEKWDIDNPVLYSVKTIIRKGDEILDEYKTTFGVRKMRFSADEGFFLNDRRVQLRGVNLHHDQGPLGAAFNPRAMERQLKIMKDMGCNAIRNSHNTAAPELLELCDKMGLLLLDEVFDKYDAKADITDTTDFENFANRNIRNFVLRDRNHPCIFLWSVGNEIKDVMNNTDNGFYKLKTMVNYVRKYDSSRPVTLVCSQESSASLRHFDYYDVHCWNYGRRYSLARQIEPNKSVIISESASTLSSRGFYELFLPVKKTDFTKSLQVSSYDLNAPNWAEIADDDFMWQEEESYIAGEFVWTGFDYLGEPTPYDNESVIKIGMTDSDASRSSYFGIVDLCGIPKDRYYLYKSNWKPEENMIHILPHWNWEGMEGKNIPVFVYTNGDSAELFLNGVSQGMKKKIPDSDISVERYRLIWKTVNYEPGEIKAVAYKNGDLIGEQIIKTASNPYEILLSPDRVILQKSQRDLSYILVKVVDKEGNLCPLANNQIDFSIEGVGHIAGVGNGNPQSFEAFKTNKVKLFNGKAMLIIEGGEKAGDINISAFSNGLKMKTTHLKVL